MQTFIPPPLLPLPRLHLARSSASMSLRDLIVREGYVLKHGLRLLWQQSKGLPRASVRSEAALRALAARSATATWPTPREDRHTALVRSDVLLGLPAGLVLGVVPGSLFLLVAANKWAPAVLPSTFTQVRHASTSTTRPPPFPARTYAPTRTPRRPATCSWCMASWSGMPPHRQGRALPSWRASWACRVRPRAAPLG